MEIMVSRRIASIVGTIVLALLAIGPAMAATYTLDENDNGSTVEVVVGDLVGVTLYENPTTGYMWDVTLSPGLKLMIDDYLSPQTNLVGAGGEHTWQFMATSAGDHTFSAVYRRPWLVASEEDEAYVLTVRAIEGVSGVTPGFEPIEVSVPHIVPQSGEESAGFHANPAALPPGGFPFFHLAPFFPPFGFGLEPMDII
ncbi:MAG: protease inhibitor I42 family protein [Methanomicrobiales archaeon]|jgi:inhibitor of cysteine peptidase|nr:protease inhibitor I42 family protein [Methanomicrobiales archaeon]